MVARFVTMEMATGKKVAGKGRNQASGFEHIKFEILLKFPVAIRSRQLDFESGGQGRSGLGI